MADLLRFDIPAADDPFWGTRGCAIQVYASLEQALSMLFGCFAGLEPDAAAMIFWKFNNKKDLGIVMGEILEKKTGNIYAKFWKSLTKLIRSVNDTRNIIVHWNVGTHIDLATGYKGLILIPPNFWKFSKDGTSPLNSSDLFEFMRKCFFAKRLCDCFFMYLTPELVSHLSEGEKRTWRDIFAQEVAYPPPSTHPLFATWQGPGKPASSIPGTPQSTAPEPPQS